MADPNRTLELLESSFAALAPRGDELVDRFYTRLFEVAPGVRAIFPDGMAAQKRALLGALGMIVCSLRVPDRLGAYLESMSHRQVGYAAIAAHYDVVGVVLLETLTDMAGDLWTDELAEAWTSAYGAIRDTMLASAAAKAA